MSWVIERRDDFDVEGAVYKQSGVKWTAKRLHGHPLKRLSLDWRRQGHTHYQRESEQIGCTFTRDPA